MKGMFVAASLVAAGALCFAPAAYAQTKATSAAAQSQAHVPAKHGAKPVSGGKRYKCHKPRGVAGAVGLPNCDNPHNVDNPN